MAVPMSALACSALFTAIAAIFVTLYPAAFGVDVTSVEDKVLSGGHLDGTTYKLIFGPIHMGCGVAQLEQPSRKDAVPTLRLTLKGRGGSDADVNSLISVLGKVVRRKKPFVIIWDARHFWPVVTRAQIRMLNAWFLEHYLQWDSLLQAHVTVIGNPIARVFASLATRVFRPPQPIKHLNNLEDADSFARSCCSHSKAMSYVKSDWEYDSAPGFKAFPVQ